MNRTRVMRVDGEVFMVELRKVVFEWMTGGRNQNPKLALHRNRIASCFFSAPKGNV